MRTWQLFMSLAVLWALALAPVRAADPVRGEQLFMRAPSPGLLGCVDCHSDAPTVNNFGFIWSGRNAVSLILRAVQINTGGMSYLQNHYTPADFADIAAYLGNIPNQLRFASTALGSTSATQSVAIHASLKQPLEGLSLAIEGDFVIADNRCGGAVPRFSSCHVGVAFRPSGEGERRGALVISHNGAPTPVRLPLSGTSPALPRGVASIEPLALDFGSGILGGLGARRDVLVANRSVEAFKLLGIQLSGNDFRWAGGSCLPSSVLQPGQRCVLALQFAPRSGGLRNATLTLQHDGVGGSASVALSGLAAAGVDERLEAEPWAIDFGVVAPGQRSAEATLRWTQRGGATLAAVPLQPSDPRFVVQTNNCSGAVAPHQRCEAKLVFAPTRAVASSGALRLGGQLQAPLQGSGGTHARLQAEPLALHWQEGVGHAGEQQVTLRNGGLAALRLGGFSVTGPEAAAFAVLGGSAGSCASGSSLAPGQSCELPLRLNAAETAGARSASLLVNHDGPASPLVLPLSAQVLASAAARAVPDVAALDFGTLPPPATPQTHPRGVLVTNRGRAPLAWAALGIAGDDAAAFSLSGSCALGAPLPPNASCQAAVRLMPGASGSPSATLVLQPVNGEALTVNLRAMLDVAAVPGLAGGSPASALASLAPALQAAPTALQFEAINGQAGAAQVVSLRNSGNQVLALLTLQSTSTAFMLEPGDCASNGGARWLLPGETCQARVRWTGAVAAASGARLQVQTDVLGTSVEVPLAVTEDPAQGSNVGAGGGAMQGHEAWLACFVLALAIWRLRASRHGDTRAAHGHIRR